MTLFRRPHVLVAFSFAVNAVVLFYVFSWSLFAVAAAGHTYDTSPQGARNLQVLYWVLYALPASWILAAGCAATELARRKRAPRLILWSLFPVSVCFVIPITAVLLGKIYGAFD